MDAAMKKEKEPVSSASAALSRREFVAGAGVAALFLAMAQRSMANSPKSFPTTPFTLGVASGDPWPTGFVIWTRLALRPLEAGGGMPADSVEVSYKVAEDQGMTKVVASGKGTASADKAHSIHVEVDGLQSNRQYWYQFEAGGYTSSIGRSRTMPGQGETPEQLRFAFVSCQHYEQGYYTAFQHLAAENPDLVIHLGDYIYEGGIHPKFVRRHNGDVCRTLDDYRARYALYKTDPLLQKAHLVAPWIVTWDDHEVSGDYAGLEPKQGDTTLLRDFVSRRAAAYKAYFEHMPLRRSSMPANGGMLLYRGFEFGTLASFHVLDTRQYRTPQAFGGGKHAPSPKLLSDRRTIMGERQKEWLYTRLAQSKTTWNIVAQQVMMARVDTKRGEDIEYNMDKWAGYEADRRDIIRHMQSARVKNPIVITGDIHSNWANEILNDFDGDAKHVAVEFVGTSISSGGNGEEFTKKDRWLKTENPHVKFHNAERGYVMCTVTPQSWKAEYRTVPYVDRPGAPLATRARFVVDSGSAHLRMV